MKIFVDFDGTITKEDVGNTFFREFGGEVCTGYIADYKAERISAKELFRKEVEAIGLLDVRKAEQFLHRQQIDFSFKRCADFCRSRRIDMHLLSDGLDYYIREIVLHNDITDASFFSNQLELTTIGEGQARPAINFPYDDAECTRCACCKRNVILDLCGEDDIIAYVGERYSDRCPAQYADIVFAKDELQRFCQERNISYFLYNSFDDVIERLEELLTKKRLKPRREAAMKRREAFIAE